MVYDTETPPTLTPIEVLANENQEFDVPVVYAGPVQFETVSEAEATPLPVGGTLTIEEELPSIEELIAATPTPDTLTVVINSLNEIVTHLDIATKKGLACKEIMLAKSFIKDALAWLDRRNARRKKAKSEGTLKA